MLHRPYIRKDIIQEVEHSAPRSEDGRFLDANTGQPIDGRYDLGHKAGHEFRKELRKAEEEGLTQEEFNERMNDSSLYQIEDPSSNRSHKYEAPEETMDDIAPEEELQKESEESMADLIEDTASFPKTSKESSATNEDSNDNNIDR